MVELFKPERHREPMRSWYEARGMTPPEDWRLPEFGFVCDEIAMAWLYKTDSEVGFIDLLVTDPKAARLRRGRAIRELMDMIEVAAKGLGIRYVEAFTKSASLLSMGAREHGFHAMQGFLVQGAI